jgi:hypothetical protein
MTQNNILGGETMTNKVKCSVANCHYWESNLCTAKEIEVAKNANVAGGYDMEAATMDNTGHSSDSSETKCVTFKPKNK